ncbi:MAG: DEAD/DEAH box helicase [Marinilabiliaceae bacterium]
MLITKKYPEAITQEYSRRIDEIEFSKNGTADKYRKMNGLLSEMVDLLTNDVPYAMSGTYAKVDYVAGLAPTNVAKRIRMLRIRGRRWRVAKQEDERFVESDIRCLRFLASMLSGAKNGAEDIDDLPCHATKPDPERTGASKEWDVLRIRIIDGKDTKAVTASEITDAHEREPITVDLSKYEYMSKWLKTGTRLNLIYHTVTGSRPQLAMVIYEPDFLVDITAISTCYTPYTVNQKLFFIKRLLPNQSTKHTLMGNLAGQFLDESLNDLRHGRDPHTNYRASAHHFFRTNALDIASVDGIDAEWHKDAQDQQTNVAQAMQTLAEHDPYFSPKIAATESSLICADLGLRGRTDLMQSDWNFLLEQKSGKMETFSHVGAKEEHYIQMMLYKTMLSVCFGSDNDRSSQYIFYSKYTPSQGLIREGGSMSEVKTQEAMRIRNSIVRDMIRYATASEIRSDMTSWDIEKFRTRNVSDRLWFPYSKPELEKALVPIKMADQLTQSYFFEMLAFEIREDLESRLGCSSYGRNGFAELWNSDYEDRVSSGNMLIGLQLSHMTHDEIDDEPGECSIATFKTSNCDTGTSEPNFRTSDPVNVYSYASDGEPDILKTIAYRATVLRIDDSTDETGTSIKKITLKLRSSQTEELFCDSKKLWAMDHDQVEAATSRTFSLLGNLLRTTKERRNLILGTRKPICESRPEGRLLDHGPMNRLVEQELNARDMFLLIGPPGTGKTSFGLMSILREELARDGHSVLLLSYTNRAVDEICSKLDKDGIDYLRIARRSACSECYHKRLLITHNFNKADDVRSLITGTRVFVGTTSSISGASGLFRLKKFDLAIVDEASQILEPSIIGILSETTTTQDRKTPCIARFVLIGDQRQLPAVVQQNKAQSRVTDKALHKIGLYDCRNSFFERMIELWGNDDRLVYQLTRQGRMHPAVAEFSNSHFYNGRLTTIPLPHQSLDLDLYPASISSDLKNRLLATRRTLFVDSHEDHPDTTDQDKVNSREADIVADMTIRILQIYKEAGKNISAQKTVGIVVPYRNQITAIRSRLTAAPHTTAEIREILKNVTIDTVERFQGSERDVIIYGLTVKRVSQLEFLKGSQFVDPSGVSIDRKLNVALTRAREQLFVVGDSEIIKTDPLYSELAQSLNAGADSEYHQ